jgi:hypothetical protein
MRQRDGNVTWRPGEQTSGSTINYRCEQALLCPRSATEQALMDIGHFRRLGKSMIPRG